MGRLKRCRKIRAVNRKNRELIASMSQVVAAIMVLADTMRAHKFKHGGLVRDAEAAKLKPGEKVLTKSEQTGLFANPQFREYMEFQEKERENCKTRLMESLRTINERDNIRIIGLSDCTGEMQEAMERNLERIKNSSFSKIAMAYSGELNPTTGRAMSRSTLCVKI